MQIYFSSCLRRKRSFSLFFTFLIVASTLAQADHERPSTNLNMRGREVTNTPDRSMGPDKGNQGGGRGKEVNGTSGPINANNNTPGVTATMSPNTILLLQSLKSTLNKIQGIKLLLVASPLLSLVTDNPKEMLGSIGLQTTMGDWAQLAEALKNLSSMETDQIDDHAETAKLFLDDDIKKAISEHRDPTPYRNEVKFWEKIQRAANNAKSVVSQSNLKGLARLSPNIKIHIYPNSSVSINGQQTLGVSVIPFAFLYDGKEKYITVIARMRYRGGANINFKMLTQVQTFMPSQNTVMFTPDYRIFFPNWQFDYEPSGTNEFYGQMEFLCYDDLLFRSKWIKFDIGAQSQGIDDLPFSD